MKISLEDITVDGLKFNSKACELIDKYNIKTYNDLKKEIERNNSEIKMNFILTEALYEIENFIQKQKNISKDILLSLDKSQDTKKIINIQDYDEIVKAIDLPYFTMHKSSLLKVLGFYLKNCNIDKEIIKYNPNISDIKLRLARQTEYKGEIIPYILLGNSGIGEVTYNDILLSLDFFDKHIEELEKLNLNTDNPFYYMYDMKLERVKRNRKEIFLYLYENGYQFIFGNNINACMKDIDKHNVKNNYRDKVETIIANYVTPEEALDIGNPKVLNKFIIPYGKK